MAAASTPFAGYGVWLRSRHFGDLTVDAPGVDCLEILSENFIGFGGEPRAVLDELARDYPIVLHGTALSIGGPDPLDAGYLDALAAAIDRWRPLCFSDHLCYSSGFGAQYHELIPLPFTGEAVSHVAARVAEVRRIAPGLPFLLENPSYYIEYRDAEMTELEFVRRVLEESDCGLLLDVNNVYVNSLNHGYDPRAFIDGIPARRVEQIHMAGHTPRGDVVIDTHGAHIIEPVYELYAYTLERTGPVTTILEWDNDVPALDVLLAENQRIRDVATRVVGEVEPCRA